MPIDPVKIPQNIYVEDRIVGPVTLKQIIICLIGMGISYAVFSILKQAGLANIVISAIAAIPAIVAATFAFIKVNGISLFRLLLLAIERAQKPSRRLWESRRGISINIRTVVPKVPEVEHGKHGKNEREGIEQLSAILDAGPEEDGETIHPVNPTRVTVEPRNGIDVDSLKTAAVSGTRGAPLTMRDIQPPQQ